MPRVNNSVLLMTQPAAGASVRRADTARTAAQSTNRLSGTAGLVQSQCWHSGLPCGQGRRLGSCFPHPPAVAVSLKTFVLFHLNKKTTFDLKVAMQ